MSNGVQKLQQAKAWLLQYLAARGAAGKVVGVDIGQVNVQGKAGYALRIYANQAGVAWLRQQGFPGALKTPYGRIFVAVVQHEGGAQAAARKSQAKADDPYKDWDVKYYGSEVEKMPVKQYGTDTEHANVKHFGTDPKKFDQVKVYGSTHVTPVKESGDKEFHLPSGAFGTTFTAFDPES